MYSANKVDQPILLYGKVAFWGMLCDVFDDIIASARVIAGQKGTA
jgi:hypothetical protein